MLHTRSIVLLIDKKGISLKKLHTSGLLLGTPTAAGQVPFYYHKKIYLASWHMYIVRVETQNTKQQYM